MPSDLFQKLNHPLEPIPTGLEPKLDSPGPIEAVIFDIYGTLVISGTGDISIAQTIDKETELRSILQAADWEFDSDEKLTEQFYFLIKADHAEAKSRGAAYPEVDIREIWTRFLKNLPGAGVRKNDLSQEQVSELAIRFECAVNPVWPMPGMRDILEHLKTAGIPLGIVSNAQFYTPVMLESFTDKSILELGFEPDLCVWSYKERLGKPSVELFEKLNASLQARGIPADRALYIGNDMLNDIWTASQAGLKTCLFAGDKRSLRLRKNDERCRNLNPDVCATSLRQLTSFL